MQPVVGRSQAPLLCLQASLLLLLILPAFSGDRLQRCGLLICVDGFDDISEALDTLDAEAEQQAWGLDASTWLGIDHSNDEEREDRHPADKMLEKRHADGSKSYILSGY